MDSRESRVRAYHVDQDGHHDLGVYQSKSAARDELTEHGADLSTIAYRECRQYGIERTRASDGVTWYPAVVVALDEDDAVTEYLTRYDGDDEYAAVDDISATEI